MDKLLLTCVFSIFLIACSSEKVQEEVKIPLEDHKLAVIVLENRKQYVNEIRLATNECLSNSKNVLTLVKADNDSKSIVELCIQYGASLYSAYSQWTDDYLIQAANAYPKQGQSQ